MLNLFKHELWSRRIGIIGWGIGLALFGAMYISVYPQISEQMSVLADLSYYQAMSIDLTSFESYIVSTVVQFAILLLIIFAVLASTGILAGEEESGTLEMVLSMPLKRWQIVTMKAAALSVAAFLMLVIAGIGAEITLALMKATTDVEMNLSTGKLFIAVINGWPLIVAVMMIGMFLGAFMPSRRTATMTLTVFFVLSYFGQVIANMVDSLEAIRPLSILHYFDVSVAIFNEGINAGDVLVLFTISAIFFALTLYFFQRRNVTVGEWPWRRATAS